MDKKFIALIVGICLVIGGFVYLSLSPSKDNPYRRKLKASQPGAPPVPPKMSNGELPPPPPPPPVGGYEDDKPDNYKNFVILKKPDSKIVLKKGDSKDLTIEIEKGSEEFKVIWLKQTSSGQYNKVFDGPTFTASYNGEEPSSYFQIQVSDNTGSLRNIYFEIENESANANDKQELAKQEENQKSDNAAVAPPVQDVKKEMAPSPSGLKIKANSSTSINQKAGTRLKLSYSVEGDEPYEIFWYHQPTGAKKGSLLKKKKKLNFSLRKLNKYHSGQFYIKIKDKNGKMHEAPKFNVKVLK